MAATEAAVKALEARVTAEAAGATDGGEEEREAQRKSGACAQERSRVCTRAIEVVGAVSGWWGGKREGTSTVRYVARSVGSRIVNSGTKDRL